MKAVIVAHDNGPSTGLGALAAELEHRGIEAVEYLSYGKPFNGSADEIKDVCQNADVVVCGFSSSEKLSFEEIVAAKAAISRNVPLVMYADTFGVYRCPWLAFTRDYASILFAQNESMKKDMEGLFARANVFVSGSPTFEAAFFPIMPRSELRNQLSVSSDDKLIMVPAGKSVVENGPLIAGTIEALAKLEDRTKYHVFITLHQGDPNPANQYKDIAKYLPNVHALSREDGLGSQEVLCGADMVITAGSATAIEAACTRIPVIDFLTEVFLSRIEKVRGTREWEREKLGITEVVRWDAKVLANAISRLSTPEGYRPMREAQEKNLPAPPRKGHAASVMADAIENLK